MSNELQLSQDLNIITAEINSYKQVAGQSIFEIGRRLKWVKENDLTHGEFGKWLDNVDINKSQASRFIKIYDEFGDTNLRSNANIGFNNLLEIASMSEEERNRTHVIPSTGETKTVDEMTVKELREVKKALKEAEEEKKKLQLELQKEKNKPVKVETKYIETVKEIDNTDYETINKLNKQLEQKQKSYQLLMNEKQAIENKMRLTEKENQEFQSLKQQIHNLMVEKEDISRQIEAATSISGLVVEIDHLIKEKLAPVKYSKAIQEVQSDDVVIENLTQIISTVQSWCDEMRKYLPYQRKIIDVEVF